MPALALAAALTWAARHWPDHMGVAVVEVEGEARPAGQAEGALYFTRKADVDEWLFLRWTGGEVPPPTGRIGLHYPLRPKEGQIQPASGARLLVVLVPSPDAGTFAVPFWARAAGLREARAALEEALPARRQAWPGAFPRLAGWERRLLKPEQGPGEATYRQWARYEWAGGAPKTVRALLSRDPSFSSRYSAVTLLKEEPPPKLVRVRKRLGWRWELGRAPRPLDEPCSRLAIPLAPDGLLELEASGSSCEDLVALAERFPLERMAQALAKPPAD